MKQLINLKIEERELGGIILELLELDIIAELNTKLPHKDWAGLNTTFFSKAAANTLPPNYSRVDYKIVLTKDIYCLKSYPLYPITVEYLELLHTYIQENLQKGFISPNSASFASLILYIKKPGGG